MNYNTGCARPTAVAPKPLGLWRCFQGKSWRLYLYFAYKSGFKRVRAILKAVEAVKVKLWCFKGIVHPTHFQKQVGWGTWLIEYHNATFRRETVSTCNNATFVIILHVMQTISSSIWEHTVEKNKTTATHATMHLLGQMVWACILQHIAMKSKKCNECDFASI